MAVNPSNQSARITARYKVQQTQLSMDANLDNVELTDEQLQGVIGGAPTPYGLWGPSSHMHFSYR